MLPLGKMLATLVKKLYVVNAMNSCPQKKYLAEQVVGIEAVGEDGAVACRRRAGVGTQFLEAEHPLRARREVLIARTEKPLGKRTRTPPWRDRPHTELTIDDDSGWVPPLRHGGGQEEGGAVVLHLLLA